MDDKFLVCSKCLCSTCECPPPDDPIVAKQMCGRCNNPALMHSGPDGWVCRACAVDVGCIDKWDGTDIHDPIVTNAKGGKGSKIYGKMSEVPPLALLEVAKVMAEGAERYPRESDGTPNWHRVGCIENLDHGMEHVAKAIDLRNCGIDVEAKAVHDPMRGELSHAACRLLMALEQLIRGEM